MEGAAQIAKGAEAEIYVSCFLGREAVVKVRSPKRYRVSELDSAIRSSRTKNETKLMKEARKAGVRTPAIYDIDMKEFSITMENVRGVKVKDELERNPSSAAEICRMIGGTVADLHNSRICHGDLTTSNMILTGDRRICMIDLSMGKANAELEDIGVDLHLLMRAFDSAHPDLTEAFGELMRAYVERKSEPERVLHKVEEIESRGRYT